MPENCQNYTVNIVGKKKNIEFDYKISRIEWTPRRKIFIQSFDIVLGLLLRALDQITLRSSQDARKVHTGPKLSAHRLQDAVVRLVEAPSATFMFRVNKCSGTRKETMANPEGALTLN